MVKTCLAPIRLRGADAESFLQAQLATDIATVSDGDQKLACLLAINGRALAVMYLKRLASDDWIACLPLEIRDAVQRRLSMFILRSKVQISSPDEEFALTDAAATGPDIAVGEQGTLKLRPATPDPVPDLAADPWLAIEARAGRPFVFAATQDLFIGQALGLDALGAISFKKGCYPGQEVVARLHFKGRSKRQLCRLERPGAATLPPGSVLHNEKGKPAAELVYEVNADDKTRAVAVVKEQYLDARLHSADDAALVYVRADLDQA